MTTRRYLLTRARNHIDYSASDPDYQLLAEIDAHLAAPDDGVPDGYALVPIEPTDRMLDAYIAALESSDVGNKALWHKHKGRKRYMAMVQQSIFDALPNPPVQS